MDELRQSQMNERRWREVIGYLEGGSIPRYGSFRANLNNFEVYQGVLYYVRVKLDGSLHFCLVIPTSLKATALGIAHESHFGQEKTISKVVESFFINIQV